MPIAILDLVGAPQLLIVGIGHTKRGADVFDDALVGVGMSPPGASSPEL